MTGRNLVRRPIKTKGSACIQPLSPSGKYEVFLGDEGAISCIYLAGLHDSDQIVKELNIYLRRYRKARCIANGILSYLRFALDGGAIVNADSLSLYREFLDGERQIALNTKYQLFQNAKGFVQYLMDTNTIPESILIRGFDPEKIHRNPKQSLAEIAAVHVDNAENFSAEDVGEVVKAFEISELDARALIYSLLAVDTVHEIALKNILKWEEDWNYVESIIQTMPSDEIQGLSVVCDFSKYTMIQERSVEEALAILYAKYNEEIPPARLWPKGVEDVLRLRGWNRVCSRVKEVITGEGSDHESDRLYIYLKNLSTSTLTLYAEVDDYSHAASWRCQIPKSVQLAIKILYAKYGRILPPSPHWPFGLVDYLKLKGWPPTRVRSAFFPTVTTLDSFFMGLLSVIELAPNVDAVLQYTYLTSFSKSAEDGKTRVFMDKFRGQGLDKNIDSNLPIIMACYRHVKRMKGVLRQIGEEGRKWLKLENTPLFLHCTPACGRPCKVSLTDLGTAADMARRFLSNTEKVNPDMRFISSATGENFRPTHALIMKLTGMPANQIQATLAHQHMKTTQIYTNRVYAQSVLQMKAKNFQKFMVSTAISGGISNKAELLDVTNDGLDKWINCEAQRIWFDDVDIIADWLVWEKAIISQKEKLESDNPERWKLYWEPRIMKYQGLLSLVSEKNKARALSISEATILPPLS